MNGVFSSLVVKMARAALLVYRQSRSYPSCQRVGVVWRLRQSLCVTVRNFSSKMSRPKVYFDMSADNQPVGRIVMEVRRFSTCTLIGAVKNSTIALTHHCDYFSMTVMPDFNCIVTWLQIVYSCVPVVSRFYKVRKRSTYR